jgi:hypothetical protein
VADCHARGRRVRVVGSALSPNGAAFSGAGGLEGRGKLVSLLIFTTKPKPTQTFAPQNKTKKTTP